MELWWLKISPWFCRLSFIKYSYKSLRRTNKTKNQALNFLSFILSCKQGLVQIILMMPNEVLKNDGGYIKTEELEWWRLKSHNNFADLVL